MSLWWLIAWLSSFIAAALSAPFVMAMYKKIGWIDNPATQSHPKIVHTYPVPRGGGLVVAVGIITGLILTGVIAPKLIGVLIGALILLISGTLDDRYDINPYLRYVFNLVAAGCVVLSGIGIDFITNPLGDGVLQLDLWSYSLTIGPLLLSLSLPGDLLALIWIVWNMNAVNWAKGVDGQLPGFVTIAAIFIALLSLRFIGDVNQTTVALLALSVSGAYAGLLLWNVYPQKMMPGYAAGSLAGYFLAVLAILSGAKIATTLLLLAIPTIDGIFVITRRLATGKSPFWGDRGHLHHRMLDAGWGKRRIAVFYWLATLFFGIIALQLDAREKLYVMMAIVILFTALVVWFKRSITSSKLLDLDNG
jgi:UDP-GlcNAc:undecaprenyl-phosphate GlcNAc-1-phosphate transferase